MKVKGAHAQHQVNNIKEVSKDQNIKHINRNTIERKANH